MLARTSLFPVRSLLAMMLCKVAAGFIAAGALPALRSGVSPRLLAAPRAASKPSITLLTAQQRDRFSDASRDSNYEPRRGGESASGAKREWSEVGGRGGQARMNSIRGGYEGPSTTERGGGRGGSRGAGGSRWSYPEGGAAGDAPPARRFDDSRDGGASGVRRTSTRGGGAPRGRGSQMDSRGRGSSQTPRSMSGRPEPRADDEWTPRDSRAADEENNAPPTKGGVVNTESRTSATTLSQVTIHPDCSRASGLAAGALYRCSSVGVADPQTAV